MNIEETKKCIAVMKAFVDGKTIEQRTSTGYVPVVVGPYWRWGNDPAEYRIKPEPRTLYTVVGGCGVVLFSTFDKSSAERAVNSYADTAIMESKEVL